MPGFLGRCPPRPRSGPNMGDLIGAIVREDSRPCGCGRSLAWEDSLLLCSAEGWGVLIEPKRIVSIPLTRSFVAWLAKLKSQITWKHTV
jgi:hypothetical protein